MREDARARFEEVYRDTARQLFAYALTRTSRAAAQDVVSATFLVAWRRLEELPSDALPWLIGVARRVLADQRRSNARQRALSDRIEARTLPDWGLSDSVANSIVLRESIRTALAQLPSRDRDVVILTAWHGLGTEQLAVALGCSKSVASL